MSAGSKLLVALIAILLAIGLAACGGDDDSGSTAAMTDTAVQNGQGDGGAEGDTPADDTASPGSAPGKGGGSNNGGGENGGLDRVESKDFVPGQHDDSGGGSDPYLVKGGDNSVQEFGGEADEAERDAAATAVHSFLDARAQEAWEAACSYLSSEVRKSLESFAANAQKAAEEQGGSIGDAGCATILAGLTNKAALPELRKEAAAADVRSLRVEGDRAFLLYTDDEDAVVAIPVVKENGDWKVGSLAGTPIVY